MRIIEAMDGFKRKHGCWPTELYLDEGTFDVLRQHSLTEEGYRRLAHFVTLVSTNRMIILATGPDHREFDYGEEGWSGPRPAVSVGEMLGFEDD